MPLVNVRLAPGELPSRVADGLFWVARYAERSDSVVRLLRTLLIGVTDAVQPWRQRDAEPILNLATWRQLVPLVDYPQSFQPIAMVQAALLDQPLLDQGWSTDVLLWLYTLLGLAAKRLEVVIAERIPMAEAERAQQLSNGGRVVGKLVLVA